MEYSGFSKPSLTEPGVKYFLHSTLKRCHQIRLQMHNYIFNIGLFLALVIIIGIILLCKYKGKPTPVEIYHKEKEKQEYILSKIQKFQLAKKQAHQELITGLPNWENEVGAINNKIIY
jgi:hypothetical protein